MQLNELTKNQEIAGRLAIFVDNKHVFEKDVVIEGIIHKVTRFAILFTRKDGTKGRAARENFKGSVVRLINPDGSKELITC